jgi:hypothetical protein
MKREYLSSSRTTKENVNEMGIDMQKREHVLPSKIGMARRGMDARNTPIFLLWAWPLLTLIDVGRYVRDSTESWKEGSFGNEFVQGEPIMARAHRGHAM